MKEITNLINDIVSFQGKWIELIMPSLRLILHFMFWFCLILHKILIWENRLHNCMPEKHTTHDLRQKRVYQRRCFVWICKYISKYQNLHTTWYREINLNNSHCKIGNVIGYFDIRIFRKLKQCCFFWYTKNAIYIHKYVMTW